MAMSSSFFSAPSYPAADPLAQTPQRCFDVLLTSFVIFTHCLDPSKSLPYLTWYGANTAAGMAEPSPWQIGIRQWRNVAEAGSALSPALHCTFQLATSVARFFELKVKQTYVEAATEGCRCQFRLGCSTSTRPGFYFAVGPDCKIPKSAVGFPAIRPDRCLLSASQGLPGTCVQDRRVEGAPLRVKPRQPRHALTAPAGNSCSS
jgi:hypothetical protein